MSHHNLRESILQQYQSLINAGKHAKQTITGGHLDQIRPHIDSAVSNLYKHLTDKTGVDLTDLHKKLTGGSLALGGSVALGGSLHMGGNFHKLDFESPRNAYHSLLNTKPHHMELMREISSQLLGGTPSPMWENYVSTGDKLESNPKNYENLIRMPNAHAAARMVEAEHGFSKGGGFWKAVRHVAHKASHIYSQFRTGMQFAKMAKTPLLMLPQLSPYKDMINGVFDTFDKVDNIANPMANAAQYLFNDNASDRAKSLAYKAVDHGVNTVLHKAADYYNKAQKIYDIAGPHSLPYQAMKMHWQPGANQENTSYQSRTQPISTSLRTPQQPTTTPRGDFSSRTLDTPGGD